jgi:hypothetical protein
MYDFLTRDNKEMREAIFEFMKVGRRRTTKKRAEGTIADGSIMLLLPSLLAAAGSPVCA